MKTKQLLEVVCMCIFVFTLTILFWAFVPALSISTPLKRTMSLFVFAVMGLLPVLMCKIMKRPLETLGFKKEKFFKQFLIAIGIWIVLFALFLGVPILFGAKLNDLVGDKINNTGTLIYQILQVIVFTGFCEEIFFRGYLLERIKTITNSDISAIIISSVLFGALHYPSSHSLMQVVFTTLLGAGYATARTKIKDCTTFSVALGHGAHDATLCLLRFFL